MARVYPLSGSVWPGLMRLSTAALYLELSESKFAKLVAARRIPASVLIDTQRRWRKVDLDAFITSTSPADEPTEAAADLDARLMAFGAS